MKIIKEKPPVWDKLVQKFGVTWGTVIVAYGDAIYAANDDIHPMKLAHESVHLVQQEEIGRDKWWDRYMEEDEFRLLQEIEAYKFEADWVREHIKDRNKAAQLIHKICKDISSYVYGNLITYSEARKLILK